MDEFVEEEAAAEAEEHAAVIARNAYHAAKIDQYGTRPLYAIEHQILDVLTAYRGQDGEPEWMWCEDLHRAIGCHGVQGVSALVDGLWRAGRIRYEYCRAFSGDRAYYRAF